MYTKLDEQRKKQIFNGFVQKGCDGGGEVEEKKEELSPAEQERQEEQNKK